MTMSGPLSLKTFAVLSSVRVTGSGPQSKVMTPPLATASTKAAPVQLAGVPVPTTVVGLETSARPASAGTLHVASAFGLPAGGPSLGLVSGLGTSTPGPSSSEQPAAQASTTPAASERTAVEGNLRSLFECIHPPGWRQCRAAPRRRRACPCLPLAAFIRAFKRSFGVAPGAFRRGEGHPA
ncbi:hypothetical protein COSO111634_04580 [Corallococcus soli]